VLIDLYALLLPRQYQSPPTGDRGQSFLLWNARSDQIDHLFLLNIERRTPNVQTSNHLNGPQTSKSKIKNRLGVIDVIAQDSNTGEAVLVMNEPEPWDDSDERLLALQERFNAYVSFLLDGEMAETNPDLAGRPARIELRCAQMPNTRALELLGMIHDQLAFQEIRMEVVVAEPRG
jgi:hypothetical protein